MHWQIVVSYADRQRRGSSMFRHGSSNATIKKCDHHLRNVATSQHTADIFRATQCH